MPDRVEPSLSAAAPTSPFRVGAPMDYVLYLLLVPVGLALLGAALAGLDRGQADESWYGSAETARGRAEKRRERVSC